MNDHEHGAAAWRERIADLMANKPEGICSMRDCTENAADVLGTELRLCHLHWDHYASAMSD